MRHSVDNAEGLAHCVSWATEGKKSDTAKAQPLGPDPAMSRLPDEAGPCTADPHPQVIPAIEATFASALALYRFQFISFPRSLREGPRERRCGRRRSFRHPPTCNVRPAPS